MTNNENVHGGHRERLKNRFLQEGLAHFNEPQVLELLLFYCIPRQDTNPIAHALLDHFGSLQQVMEATPGELKKVAGMGDGSATFISLLNDEKKSSYGKENERAVREKDRGFPFPEI